MNKLTSVEIASMTENFVANGGKILVKRNRRMLSKGLTYCRGFSAKGKTRGQIGPARDYRLGW